MTSRPPPGWATACTVPPCASQTARTIDRPRPGAARAGAFPAAPAERLEQARHVGLVHLEAGVAAPPARRGVRRRRCAPRAGRAGGCSGPRSRSGCRPAGRAGPGRRPPAPAPASVCTSQADPLDLPAHRRQRVGDAGGEVGRHLADQPPARPAPRCGPAPAARRPGALARSEASRTTVAIRRYSATSASASASVTSISVRITASGVRSSCEALATKRFCVSNAAAIRSSIASKVSASSATSSSAPDVADPLVEGLLAEPLGGRGDLVQRAQRPAGHRVRAGHPDDADRQQRDAGP